MREKRSFAERTRVLPNDEVKKKYFLVYEGKDTEAIYFEAVDVLREHISINPLIEVIPVIRSYIVAQLSRQKSEIFIMN